MIAVYYYKNKGRAINKKMIITSEIFNKENKIFIDEDNNLVESKQNARIFSKDGMTGICYNIDGNCDEDFCQCI